MRWRTSRQTPGLLVVGSRGLGGMTGLLMKSVSQGLLHAASCPVAIIPGSWRPAGARPMTTSSLVKDRPDQFGLFATVPMPDVAAATREATRALDELNADGLVLLANNRGTYLGETGQAELFLPGIPPFAADFLLDTTRAAYLLVETASPTGITGSGDPRSIRSSTSRPPKPLTINTGYGSKTHQHFGHEQPRLSDKPTDRAVVSVSGLCLPAGSPSSVF
jgi:hypothetical protein